MKRLIATMLACTVFTACSEQTDSTGDGFSLTDLNGKTHKLSDYRGKWVVVNYWATWCPPCRKEIPDFVKFQQKHPKDVQILGIAYEDADPDKLKRFANEFSINYPILTVDVYNPPGGILNSTPLPTTVIYDPSGRRVEKRIGPMHERDLEAAINPK